MRLLIATIALVAAAPASPAAPTTYMVHNSHEFQSAVAATQASGGRIVLGPGRYAGPLVVSGTGTSQIVGTPGVVVQELYLDGARNVSVGPLRISPLNGDAILNVSRSLNVKLHDLKVSALGTRFSAHVEIPDSNWVFVQRSQFSHCGDRAPHWVNCLWLRKWARNVIVENSWFHDCFGCDFVHGQVDSHLTIRSTRLERALPCRADRINWPLLRLNLGSYARQRCGHQDLVQISGGSDLRFVDNHFGMYKRGAAQLFLTGEIYRAKIAHNVFAATDSRVPGWRSRVGVIVGGTGGATLPRLVRVEYNEIYSGARRRDGYAASISVSPGYLWRVPLAKRPLIAYNVIALMQTPTRLCIGARLVENTILDGQECPLRSRSANG
jgi:hypothetical protein